MKRRLIVTIMMIITMLALTIPLAVPAFASQVTATKDVVPASPNIYHVGDTIHYFMTITNPVGNTANNTLNDIHDHMPDGSIYYFVEPGVDPPLVQAPGDSANFSLDYTVNAADIVTLSSGRLGVVDEFHATGTDSNGDLVNAEVQKNSRVIQPSIDIEKTVDCNNDGVYSTEETGPYGETGHWRIVVINTSPDSGLHDVAVTDTNGQSFGPFDLAVGENQTFEYDTPLVTQTIVNTATAEALDDLDATVGPVSSTAINNVTISPALNIEKTVDCNDDGVYSTEETGPYGETGHWRIVVTNTGDSPITNINVTDDLGPGFAPFDLAAGENQTFEYDTPLMTQTLTNTATAVGTDVFGGTVGPVSSTAINNVTISPALGIEKTVDCNNDGVYLHEDTGTAGDTGHWRIIVTNTGDSPLTDVITTDTNGMSFGPVDLAPGESVQYDYDTTVNETTTNTATATGTDVFGGTVGPVSDTAVNTVVGNQGCTPGFWKNNAKNWGAVAWVGYSPDDLFSDVFGVTPFTIRGNGKATIDDPTLLQALDANGSGINLLARSAVAALLNASNPNISYAMSVDQVIAAVQNAIAAGDEAIQALGEQLDYYNNAGCSINQQGEPIMP
jgi:uncharacterized repeat protein (TIGR01451 family)